MKERIDMRKIHEVLRLHHECKLSQRQIHESCRISRSAIQDYMLRFKAAKLSWPLPEGMSDEALECLLFPGNTERKKFTEAPLDLTYLLGEMRKPNVTLALLWEEYKQAHTAGYQYSRFCQLYREYEKSLQYSMRQIHKAGEKGFVDFGDGLKLVHPLTGITTPTHMFVFTWGASHCLFATSVLSQDVPSWIQVNVDALEHFGCCPKLLVPDNLKSAVIKACRYEPTLNPSYADFAEHYGMAILPARPYKPKDKAKVENGVKLAKRWILAKLRNHIFSNVNDLNEAMVPLVDVFNQKPLRQLKKSRQELFELWDKLNALPLPPKAYEYAEWKKVRVNINYHVSFDDHHYSVPYTLIHQELEVRATAKTAEIYRKGQRIVTHRRSYERYQYTTVAEHMPKAHQKYLEWTPERITGWAASAGPSVTTFVEVLMAERKHPEQAYKSCIGLIQLQKHFAKERVDAACRRALHYKIHSYHGVKNILTKGLDQKPCVPIGVAAVLSPAIPHDNIRGAEYFQPCLVMEGGDSAPI